MYLNIILQYTYFFYNQTNFSSHLIQIHKTVKNMMRFPVAEQGVLLPGANYIWAPLLV